jgi:hypothetical protein
MSERWIQAVHAPDPYPTPKFESNLTIATGLAALALPVTLAFGIVAWRQYCQQLKQYRITQLERSWRLRSPHAKPKIQP